MLRFCTGLERNHPESYHSFMWENFFKHIDIKPENAHILDGNAPDLVKECKDYEAKITAAGGIHLFIGGAYLFLQDFVAVVFLQDFVAVVFLQDFIAMVFLQDFIALAVVYIHAHTGLNVHSAPQG